LDARIEGVQVVGEVTVSAAYPPTADAVQGVRTTGPLHGFVEHLGARRRVRAGLDVQPQHPVGVHLGHQPGTLARLVGVLDQEVARRVVVHQQ
jgi:hypothetical protein